VQGDHCSEYIDDDFLTSEDYDFVSSIESATFRGICLTPILRNGCDSFSLAITISPKLDDAAYQYQYLSTITQWMSSYNAISEDTNLTIYYNHIIRLSNYDNYQY